LAIGKHNVRALLGLDEPLHISGDVVAAPTVEDPIARGQRSFSQQLRIELFYLLLKLDLHLGHTLGERFDGRRVVGRHRRGLNRHDRPVVVGRCRRGLALLTGLSDRAHMVYTDISIVVVHVIHVRVLTHRRGIIMLDMVGRLLLLELVGRALGVEVLGLTRLPGLVHVGTKLSFLELLLAQRAVVLDVAGLEAEATPPIVDVDLSLAQVGLIDLVHLVAVFSTRATSAARVAPLGYVVAGHERRAVGPDDVSLGPAPVDGDKLCLDLSQREVLVQADLAP